MGLIERVLAMVFGGDRNVVRETVEVFRENAEAGAARGAAVQRAALSQYGAEYVRARKGPFDQ
ncbi:MAG: carboxylesterase, partial [Sulfitobacter sp.]|nr:carboxylesterase [Sulfitobacter sp.]